MKISVVIPVFNEKDTIQEVIRRVALAPFQLHEIIVVDDYSTDGTREILRMQIKDSRCRFFFHDENQGKGAALRTGFSQVTGDIIAIQDADLEYNPLDLPPLIELIQQNKADVVYGSRFIGMGPHRAVFFWHMVGNRFLTMLSNMLTNINLTDMETCYKVFRRDILEKIVIEEDRFGFEPEITAKVAKMHCRIYEVGISYSGRTYAEGKKITWRDGFRAIYSILKYNLFR